MLKALNSSSGGRHSKQMGILPVAAGQILVGAMLMLGGACEPEDIPCPWPKQPTQWLMAGRDLHNTRWQPHEKLINRFNASDLAMNWVLETAGDVTATPAVDLDSVYISDWGGQMYKLDRYTGEVRWQISIPEYTGVPGNFVRVTPAIYGNTLIIGDQAGRVLSPASVMALDKRTGALLWRTQIDPHPASVVTQSPVVFNNRVYVGVSSHEETIAFEMPEYECCSFRGSMLALDATTGEIVWRTYMAPEGYTGVSIWGSTPVIDAIRGSVYIATGNNYGVPAEVAACVEENIGDAEAVEACVAPDNHFDAVMALDLKCGSIKWVTRSIPFDAWTLGCIFPPERPNCPQPFGPDFDFGQGPALFYVDEPTGERRQLLGAGQKSGRYWTYDPDDGEVVWSTQDGVGLSLGGHQWGSAVDGKRVYTQISNFDNLPWELIENGLPTGEITTCGFWSALDARTGMILWQTPDPQCGPAQAPVTVANDVVYACSSDPLGFMYALDAATGTILWGFPSGGSCGAGAAITDGTVYWGSGYSNLSIVGTTPNNKFYSFSPL